MVLNTLIDEINYLLPPESAMENDRLGLQIQAKNSVEKILVVYELNYKSISEAIETKSDCIITFHPLIYQPLKQIHLDERVGAITTQLIKNEISLFSVHTAFDAYKYGTSRIFANKLGLETQSNLVENAEHPDTGMGVICINNENLTLSDLLDRVCNVSNSPLKYCEGKTNTPIRKIGILGGSGGSFLNIAMNKQLDAFITADLSYHQFHLAAGKMMLIDPGHYETEQFIVEGLTKLIYNEIGKKYNIEIVASKNYTNPIKYYPNTTYFENKQKEILNNKIEEL
jgi:dinuclear metal center YbgI/SA1388 family protein